VSQSESTNLNRRTFGKWLGSAALGLALAWQTSIIPSPFKVGVAPEIDPNSRPIDNNYRVQVGDKYSFVVQTPELRAKIDKFYGRTGVKHQDYPVQTELIQLGIGDNWRDSPSRVFNINSW